MVDYIDKLPLTLRQKARSNHRNHYWRVVDIPDVIEAARAASLRNMGGTLFFIGQPGTPSEAIKTYEIYWVHVRVHQPRNMDWQEAVDDAARQALQQFEEQKAEYDFLKEAQKFAQTTRAFAAAGGDLTDIMYFEWLAEDQESHLRTLEDIRHRREQEAKRGVVYDPETGRMKEITVSKK